jgi:osmotically inducible protein OsmC
MNGLINEISDSREVGVSTRKAQAKWIGNLKEGEGHLQTESGVLDGSFSFDTRFEEKGGTNPEELIGAALSGCYSMALSYALEQEGYTPQSVSTSAHVHIEKVEQGFEITSVDLKTDARVEGIEESAFQKIATEVKENCPVSKALKGGPKIRISADL